MGELAAIRFYRKVPAMKHRFGPALICNDCGREWSHHQADPRRCKKPKGYTLAVVEDNDYCGNGHKRTPTNTYVYEKGSRRAGQKQCRDCRKEGRRERHGGERRDYRNGTHCSRGHERNDENTYHDKTGQPSCRLCRKITNDRNNAIISEKKRAAREGVAP